MCEKGRKDYPAASNMFVKGGEIEVAALCDGAPARKTSIHQIRGKPWVESARRANLPARTTSRRNRRRNRSKTTTAKTATSPRQSAIATAKTTNRCRSGTLQASPARARGLTQSGVRGHQV